MPSSHRHYAEWTPDRFRRWVGKIGPSIEGLISAVLAGRLRRRAGRPSFKTMLDGAGTHEEGRPWAPSMKAAGLVAGAIAVHRLLAIWPTWLAVSETRHPSEFMIAKGARCCVHADCAARGRTEPAKADHGCTGSDRRRSGLGGL
jgi:hypothetical protein